MFNFKLKEFACLLREQFYRLKYSKCFYVLLAIFPLYCLVQVGINVLVNNLATETGTSLVRVNMLFSSVYTPTTLGVIMVVFAAVFGCGEFTNHTMRGKISSGFSRSAIFFSTLVFNYTVCAIYAVVGAVALLAVGTPLLGWQYSTETLNDTFAQLFSLVPTVAFITMVCFGMRSRGSSLGVNIGVFLACNMLSLFILLFISQVPVFEWIVRLVFLSFSSYIASYGTESASALSYWQVNMVLNYLLTTGFCIVIGWFVFLRAEIK
jgi:hypothetical protein